MDIDGVINTTSTPFERGDETLLRVPVEEACVHALNDLVVRAGAKVVISSSWRMFAHWPHLGPALQRHGVVAEIIGETPRPEEARRRLLELGHGLDDILPRQYERGMDVWCYLAAHPEVEEFVALDDGSDWWRLRPAWYLTDAVTGLTTACVDQALALFKGSREILKSPDMRRDRGALS
jgi:hypothetical protein